MNNEKINASLAFVANMKKREKSYWLNRLSDQPQKSSFPFDFEINSSFIYRLETVDFSLPEGIARQFIDLSKGNDARLFIFLIAGIFILLRKYTGNKDILLGIPVSRPRGDVELLNSALAIRYSFDDTLTFAQLLPELGQTLIEAGDHQNFPIRVLSDLLGLSRLPGDGFPLFDVVVSLKNMHQDTLHEFSPGIIVSFESNGKGIEGIFSYNTGRYRPDTIARLINHYRTLLETVMSNLHKKMSDIELLSTEEKQQILMSFNDTDADFPENTSVHELIDRQAEQTPHAAALVYKEQRLSYAELKNKTDGLAAELQQRGLGPDQIAAVIFDHSPGMVVALVGILKSGAAYLPIDPDYPQERIDYILKDSNAKIMIGRAEVEKSGRAEKDFLASSLPRFLASNPLSLAYIIYTSGSTGWPKGVMINHRSFIEFTTWAVVEFEHRVGCQVLLSNSYASDGSIQQIFPPLISGGTLHLIDKELRLDVARYLDYLKKNKINNIDEVPVLMKELIAQIDPNDREEKLPDLTCLSLGSEYVPIELVKKCRKHLNRSGRIINAYGPAEASVETTTYHCDGTSDSEQSLIGKPRRNIQVYILDETGHCCPIGVRGEICISGVGLARGYLNQPELTAEKFIKYRSYRSYKTYIFYKTGDRGCWLPDGNIRFCGRIDDQIKIRGYRVELQEIENVIKNHKEIKDAVVLTRENSTGEIELCAYYVPKPGAKPAVREYLEIRLPSYMTPSYLMELEKIPLTPHGKVDKKALPEPGNESIEEYVAPRNVVEEKLVEIWNDILNKDKQHSPLLIGIKDNFFKLGGHSLKAAALTFKIQKQLGVDMPLIQVFKTPTISGLGAYLKQAKKSEYKTIEPVELKEHYCLTPVQKRLYFLQQLVPNSSAYNVPGIMTVDKHVGKEKLEAIFKTIIRRHEILRTSFTVINNEPRQIIHEEVPFEIGIVSMGNGAWNLDDNGQGAPFDLSRAPLLRVAIVKEDDDKYILALDMHHVICDPISHDVLLEEFNMLNRGMELPGMGLQYKDYSEWQNSKEQLSKIKQQETYWVDLFSDEYPVLALPLDFPRPQMQSFEGASVNFILQEGQDRLLKKMAAENNVTLYMLILAIYNVLLAKLSGQEDIIIGMPISLRLHENLEKMIGMFVNTLAMRSYPAGYKTFSEFLQEVKTRTLEAYMNREYPFEELVEKISIKRDAGRNALFDVVFNHLNQPGAPADDTGIAGDNLYRHTKGTSKFDMNLSALELDKSIYFYFEYCTRLFKAETIDRITGYFKKIVSDVLMRPDEKIATLEIISPAEKKQILEDFNGANVPSHNETAIFEWFERQAAQKPDSIALEGPLNLGAAPQRFVQLSYKELNKKSNHLAHVLRSKGVRVDTIVGIVAERSVDTVTGIVGILKAGGAYLPIDPDYPEARILSTLNDSNTSHLLTSEQGIRHLDFTILRNLTPTGQNIIITPPRPSITNFDQLPFPDRTLVNYKKYHQNIGNAPARYTVSLLSSRGCPYNCMFCHKIWPKQHIARSAENIFQEIRYSYEAGIRRFVFLDDIFNFNLKNSSKLLEMIIQHRMDIRLFFPNGLRSDRLTKDYIDLLANAGAVNIDVALESASPRIQKMIRKHLDLEKFHDNINYILNKYPQIILELEMMFGFPTETEEEANATYELLKNLKWVHFPNLNILKIYPNTDISRIAIENGISEELINRSSSMAYHEIPETLPFPKEFALHYQSRFVSDYFLSKERLLHVLPAQMKTLTEDELVKKYNSYLPINIKSFKDILEFTGISIEELGDIRFLREEEMAVPDYEEKIKNYFPVKKEAPDAFRVLLLDCSQLFSPEAGGMLYDVIEAPLGLMYVLTYINQRFESKVTGKIAKSRIDFDSFDELKTMLNEFRPQLIGIRALSFYKNLFHKTTALIKQWHPDIPIITGGPYSTSDYSAILSDRNVDIAVLGEGEITIAELIESIMKNNGKLPTEDVLKQIPGLAFIAGPDTVTKKNGRAVRDILFLDRLIAGDTGNSGENTGNPERINQPQDLAYILYTSGSTGKPKGVSMPHRAVSNLIGWHLWDEELSKAATTLQFASFCFDVSFQEIFSTLCTGGKLYVLSKEVRQDISTWFPLLAKNKIERAFLPFTVLQQFSALSEDLENVPRGLKEIITAGERLQITSSIAGLVKKLKNCTLYNHYGPTETHVVTTFALKGDVDGWPQFPPIGKPVANSRICILDRSLTLIPVGVSGELCISGAAVAGGYLNNPELTAEKFIKYRSNRSYKTYIFYKTGDLARWLADGNIEFLGRIDHQVKIRGFRIELGEIENRLLTHHLVKETVVICKKEEGGANYLCAYIVPVQDFPVQVIREFLSKHLPDYMIPSHFVMLEQMPLTSRGKLDRNALPGLEIKPGEFSTYAAPGNEIEKKMLEIWADTLAIEKNKISIYDNFFQLGGHSLKATIAAAKIHKTFDVQIPLSEFFKTPNIKEFAGIIAKSGKTPFLDLECIEKKEFYHISYNQERLWIINQRDPGSSAFHMNSNVILTHKVEEPLFKKVIYKIMQRHESLRTGFKTIAETPVQYVATDLEIPFKSVDISFLDNRGKYSQLEQVLSEEVGRPFDLKHAPLFRTLLVKTKEEEFHAQFTMHHIISDGWSLEILKNEFFYFYDRYREGKKAEIEPLVYQYKDFAHWRLKQLENPMIKENAHRYWMEKINQGFPVLELPGKNKKVKEDQSGSAAYRVVVEVQGKKKLEQLAKDNNTTLFTVMYAIFNVLFANFSGQQNITCGIASAGRDHTSLQPIMGFFVNALILVNHVTPDEPFDNFLPEVHRRLQEVLQHQHYPLELVLEDLQMMYPPISVFFNMLNLPGTIIKEELESTAPYHMETVPDVKFDMALYNTEYPNGIEIQCHYRKALFKPEVVENVINEYIKLLDYFSTNSGKSLKMYKNESRKTILKRSR